MDLGHFQNKWLNCLSKMYKYSELDYVHYQMKVHIY